MSNSAILKGGATLFLTTSDPIADELGALLDGVDPSHVDADRCVELERTSARCGLRAAEHDPDLLPELVDEDTCGTRLGDGACELAERLTHEARLQSDRLVADLTFELRSGDQGGDRVDHDDIDRAGAHEHVGDLERLLARVGL